MDEVAEGKAGRVDPPGFEDRHPLLHPQHRLAPRSTWAAGTRPSRHRAGGGEQFGQRSAAAARADVQRSPSPLAEGRFQPAGARRGRSAGDQGQASRHTTHNVLVLLLFLSREFAGRVNRATRERPRLPRGNGRSRAPPARVARPRHAEAPCGSQSSSTALSRLLGPARAPSAAATMPSRRDQIASVGTGGLSAMSRDRRIVDLVAGDPSRRAARHCSACGSPEKGEPSVTTARTRSGHGPRQLAREQPAEAPADQQHRLARRRTVEPRAAAARACRRVRPGCSPCRQP